MTYRQYTRTRIGSDQARQWARSLKLGNPYAKFILMEVANYINENGLAWPGIRTIAAATDLSEDTVVNRLSWLESIGAIALFKNWVDENGVRNRDGRGRKTSSEISFLLEADPEEIESRAAATTKPKPLRGAALGSRKNGAHDELAPAAGGESDEIAPAADGSHVKAAPATGGQQPVSARLASGWTPSPAARILESEKEDSPPTPLRGVA